jgi:hypothetical protein
VPHPITIRSTKENAAQKLGRVGTVNKARRIPFITTAYTGQGFDKRYPDATSGPFREYFWV